MVPQQTLPETVRPWAGLPATVGPLLRPSLPGLVEEVITAVATEVPDYRRPLEGAFGAGVRIGVEIALARFLDLPGTDAPALLTGDRDLYVGLGRGELRQGRSLDALLAAYRTGARVAFHRFALLARDGGVAAEALIGLAEAVFAYIDELSAASAEGYAVEQSEHAGQRERRRAELMRLLLTGGGDAAAVADAAADIGWSLPDRVVVVMAQVSQRTAGWAVRLGASALVGEYAGRAMAVVAEPTSRRARGHLAAALAGAGAVVGPVRAWPQAPASLRLASHLARLVDQGIVAADPAWYDDHRALVVLHRDPEAREELVRTRLAPLSGLRPAARERLAETLLAWLAFRGERSRVAAALHVHPQTIGYRLGQLRERFGAALDDPDARFELELALRARP